MQEDKQGVEEEADIEVNDAEVDDGEINATRLRMESEDIWKEIDDQVFAERVTQEDMALDKQAFEVVQIEGQEPLVQVGLKLSDLNDKNLQKLQKLSELTHEKIKALNISTEKSTKEMKRINKAFKMQQPQILSKYKVALSEKLKFGLNVTTKKLRDQTVQKAQDFYSERLDNSMQEMIERLNAKAAKWREQTQN